MKPPVPRTERDVGVRAERVVVVVTEGVECRLRDAGASRGEDDGRRTLPRNLHRLRKPLALSEQCLRLWPAKADASCLQELFVFGDQGRTGCPSEERRDPLWWETVADGTGYMSGPDQGQHQSHVTLVFGQIQRHPAPWFEFSETERR